MCAACVRFQICKVNFQVGLKHGHLKNWKSEEISSDLQSGTSLFFLLKNMQGHSIAKVLGCLPVCIRAKNDLLWICACTWSAVLYITAVKRIFPIFLLWIVSRIQVRNTNFGNLNSILIFSAVKQTTWEDDLLRIVTDSQCQENSNQVNLRESKGSLELV